MSKELQDSINQLNEFAGQLKTYLEENNGTEVDFDKVFSKYGLSMNELEDKLFNDYSKLPLPFSKVHPDAISPFYNYETDSGFDFYSVEEIEIPAFGRALVPTGLCFDIKDGYEIQVRSKSGLAINQGLMCLNSPGTVDNGYTGEVKVIIFNTNNHPVLIKKGMKVAQGVFSPVVNGKWIEPQERKEIKEKDRNANGFGSTGI